MRTFRGVVLAILIGVTPLVVATPALAQGDTDSGVGIGALAGLARSSARFDTSDVFESSAGNGVMFGIWFGGNRNGRVGFMGELNYVVKKATVDFLEGKITYLEIPALFRINLGSRSRNGASVYALVGPVIDIKLKGTENGEDVGDFYNGFDIGVMAGAGVEVNRAGFEVRGNWGQRSIFDPALEFEKVTTFTLQVLAKFRFN